MSIKKLKTFKVNGFLVSNEKLPEPKAYCCVMSIEDDGCADLSIAHNGEQLYIPLKKVEKILKEYKYNKKGRAKKLHRKMKSNCRARMKSKTHHSTLR